ncbi:HAD family hydrolase [Goodfellowiella coeruleoviolacea]|uniref:Haloacid dehalogenase n=1 Tax=Goodfellowiella coeruleoviolacea TaxID=334858 RepID=A0AAE3KFS3_9PSEU|nr:HAD family hydrolase [Goodfellowiella coeruleoviolacea]MCP2164719.1 Haloacid dehalogenase superfamily, subfamily IA, variant 2 with 3rd motif like haloacid dehalogenase/haloacid dehalogenase superfamily, subfamily IA, variant 3 with third motif having DD or ED/haloacid dehalogenase superfamily, subfamily IA, variant 1 with third motif having Dx(3-4)D or Dx(3-4)E [Goodfellowiella coeruleoviolacea]
MAIQAVLFDFSGTLFRLENEASWLGGLMDDATTPLDARAQAELLHQLTVPTGPAIAGLGPDVQRAWQRRDLDPELHRTVYLAVIEAAGVRDRALAERIYEQMVDPANWVPYPDAVAVLRRLSEAGLAVGVVSNIAWDIRQSLDEHGASGYVDEVVMSYQVGAVKPEPEIFRLACARLGVAPEHALMVGDSAEADGGAAAVGCAVALVEPLPTAQRPDGLVAALTARGVLR